MTRQHITPRRVAPYVIGGATGVHILARMRHLSRQPANDAPLQIFLLKNTDVLLSLGGATVVIWQLATHRPRRQQPGNAAQRPRTGSATKASNASLIAGVVHELRQVFTMLLLGLGLIKRQADAGQTVPIAGVVQRLKAVVHQGIDAVDELEPAGLPKGPGLTPVV